ncbi:hypothetical protein GCM10023334_107690 [Nonomuraea thailandensis]
MLGRVDSPVVHRTAGAGLLPPAPGALAGPAPRGPIAAILVRPLHEQRRHHGPVSDPSPFMHPFDLAEPFHGLAALGPGAGSTLKET